MKSIFPSQVNVNIYESVALLRKIFLLCKEHKKRAEAFEANGFMEICSTIDQEKLKLENLYKLPIIRPDEGENLIKYLDHIDTTLRSLDNKNDRESEALKLLNNYTGTLQNELKHYVTHVLKQNASRIS